MECVGWKEDPALKLSLYLPCSVVYISGTMTLLFQGTVPQFHLILNTEGQRSHRHKGKMEKSNPCRLARGT